MTVGSKALIQHREEDGKWSDYMTVHLVDVNPFSSLESQDDGGELPYQTVSFTARYRKKLAAVEFDMPNYRIVWRGRVFDVRGYDDFKYRHLKVTLRAVSHG